MSGITDIASECQQDNSIKFFTGKTEPIMEFKQNGDIIIRGKLVENDKEVVDAMREFLKSTGYLRQ